MMKRGIQFLQKLKKTLKKSFVRTELFNAVRPEPVEGRNGAQEILGEGFCNKLIIVNLICTWFDRLTTNGLNQRFLNGYARLAIILCLSLLIHLAIIYGVPWSPVGEKNASISEEMQHGQPRLTVTLTPTPHATAPQAIEKTAVMEVADVDTETNTAGDSGFSTTNTLISTALDSRYFTLAELDQHPAIARDISDNPPELHEYSQGGEIVLRLWIDKTGKVVNVDTISSNLPPVFVDSARAGFLQAVFQPGRKYGNAVATVMDIVVSYEPAAVNRTPTSIHGQLR